MQLRNRKRSRAVLVVLMLTVAAAGFALGAMSGPQQVRGAELVHPIASGGAYAIADVVDAVGPAVVFIEVEYMPVQTPRRGATGFPFFDFFPFPSEWWPYPEPTPRGGSGSGFIIDESGLVLTNQHLFAQPELIESIRVTLPGREEPISATLRGADFELDLAILELEGEGPFPVVPLGDSDDVRVGEWVVAIGNPYRLEHTVTAGVLSATGRQIEIIDQEENRRRTYRNLMQTDAAINPGNSGGPLLNLRGEAIGINTAVRAGAQGIGFAIPINEAKAVLEDLVSRGMVIRPFIGISYDTVDEAYAQQFNLPVREGIIILDVIPGTAAQRAGLRVRDVIVDISGKPIADTSDFLTAIDGMKVGDVLILTVVRDGREIVVRLEVGERPPGL